MLKLVRVSFSKLALGYFDNFVPTDFFPLSGMTILVLQAIKFGPTDLEREDNRVVV